MIRVKQICTKCKRHRGVNEFIFLKSKNVRSEICKSCRSEEYRLKFKLNDYAPKASKFMAKVREYRKSLQISIRDMAINCNMNIITYSELENGMADPNIFQKQIIKNYITQQLNDNKPEQKAN